ncbi:alpha/beta hydrolase [Okibacterium endophyticum]
MFWWAVGVVGVLVGGVVVAFIVSPVPGAFIIRRVFTRNGSKVLRAMQPHSPAGVTTLLNEVYRPHDARAELDVYYPDDTRGSLPTIVWAHGGAWISGGKADDVPYFKLIAAAGYTVVGVDYSVGPEHRYPTAVHQLNDALRYITDNAARLHVDPHNIIVAGDSAGAQLTSQIALIVTDPPYAERVGIKPSLTPGQLKGVILNCGIYDVLPLVRADGLFGWGDRETLWAYTGARDFERSEAIAQMSTLDSVTKAFPPTYISGGNADPLTRGQSKPLAQKLISLGVQVTTLFWPDDYAPALGHEYQFDLDTEAAQTALARTLSFIRTAVGEPSARHTDTA